MYAYEDTEMDTRCASDEKKWRKTLSLRMRQLSQLGFPENLALCCVACCGVMWSCMVYLILVQLFMLPCHSTAALPHTFRALPYHPTAAHTPPSAGTALCCGISTVWTGQLFGKQLQ